MDIDQKNHFLMNSAENAGNGRANESVTDYQSFNADIIALGDKNYRKYWLIIFNRY
jgi:hypothetical protein